MRGKKYLLFLFILIPLTLTVLAMAFAKSLSPFNKTASPNSHTAIAPSIATNTPAFIWPIDNAPKRITKLPFGLYVTPQNSPVNSKRFTGYHVGTDFETTPAESNIDIPIKTICTGKLALKKWASGYGGVAVQRCQLNGRPITVIYGHLKLASIQAKLNTSLPIGATLGILGQGQSVETDGERKHLHLGIHFGSAINILGYVQKAKDLAGWIDPASIIK